MNAPRTLAMAAVALCLAAMLVLPAAAAPTVNAERAGKKVDPGLADDLWKVHAEYRLKIYELHVERAQAVIAVLEDHGCDVSELNGILRQVQEQKDPLRTALENRDRDALKTINQELHRLAQEFRKEVRNCIRECSGTPSSGEPVEEALA